MDIGSRLHAVRMGKGLSQRELAKRVGVTNSTISLIEQNKVSPSVGSLKKLLECIPMSLAEFFTFELDENKCVVFNRDTLPNLGNETIQFLLVGSGVKDRNMCIMREVYEPNADTGPEVLEHAGQEGGVVVRGEIELTVEGQSWVLRPGDAYYFESRLAHRFRNLSESEPCEIVSANSPPTF